MATGSRQHVLTTLIALLLHAWMSSSQGRMLYVVREQRCSDWSESLRLSSWLVIWILVRMTARMGCSKALARWKLARWTPSRLSRSWRTHTHSQRERYVCIHLYLSTCVSMWSIYVIYLSDLSDVCMYLSIYPSIHLSIYKIASIFRLPPLCDHSSGLFRGLSWIAKLQPVLKHSPSGSGIPSHPASEMETDQDWRKVSLRNGALKRDNEWEKQRGDQKNCKGRAIQTLMRGFGICHWDFWNHTFGNYHCDGRPQYRGHIAKIPLKMPVADYPPQVSLYLWPDGNWKMG